jgi:hypothetical protein
MMRRPIWCRSKTTDASDDRSCQLADDLYGCLDRGHCRGASGRDRLVRLGVDSAQAVVIRRVVPARSSRALAPTLSVRGGGLRTGGVISAVSAARWSPAGGPAVQVSASSLLFNDRCGRMAYDYGLFQWMYRDQGLSIREIARVMGVSRDAVRRAVRELESDGQRGLVMTVAVDGGGMLFMELTEGSLADSAADVLWRVIEKALRKRCAERIGSR